MSRKVITRLLAVRVLRCVILAWSRFDRVEGLLAPSGGERCVFDPALEEKAIILLKATHWTSITITLVRHPIRKAEPSILFSGSRAKSIKWPRCVYIDIYILFSLQLIAQNNTSKSEENVGRIQMKFM